MLSKAQIKYIRSLTQQKYRKQHNVFVVEGDKIAREWLVSNAQITHIIALQDWLSAWKQLIDRHPEAAVTIVDQQTLASISSLQTPNKAFLVVSLSTQAPALPSAGWAIALDTIQDPGNMGTIIRIADWFGIPHIICSPSCVDIYSPKVVQAAMGGHLRVAFHEVELADFLKKWKLPVMAAVLQGKSLYDCDATDGGLILIGNESKGLHPDLLPLATQHVTIPRRGGAESLNAAVSLGILCSHLLPH